MQDTNSFFYYLYNYKERDGRRKSEKKKRKRLNTINTIYLNKFDIISNNKQNILMID